MPAGEKRQPVVPRARHMTVLTDALDGQGRYDAAKLAGLLDWTRREIAQYLQKDPSAISRNGASLAYQEPLSQLAATFAHLLDLMNGDLKMARAWMRTPVKVLNGKSPKNTILRRDLKAIDAVLAEVESGFAA